MSRRVLVCCPNWRHLGLECHRGLMSLAAAMDPTPKGWGDGQILWGGEVYELRFAYCVQTNMPFAREYLVDQALELEAEISVHVDADTSFARDDVLDLVELIGRPEDLEDLEESPIVCATKPIALRHPPHNVAAFPFPVTSTCPREWWAEKRDVVDVAATGMGLTAFLTAAARMVQRPWFPLFDNRFGPDAIPVTDLPPWVLTPMAKTVGSDVGFTCRLADVGRVVIDARPRNEPVRHVVEISLAPFEVSDITGDPGSGGPGAGRKAVGGR